MNKMMEQELSRLEEGFDTFQKNQNARLSTLEMKLGTIPKEKNQATKAETIARVDGHRKALEDFMRGRGDVKSLNTGEVPGSYLLPEVVQERIEKKLGAESSFKNLARHMMISSGSVDVIVDKDLPGVGWIAEAADRAETETGSLSKIKIELHELYAKPKITQKILDDAAINVEDWIVDKVSEKMRVIEDQSFLVGDGRGKPRGFLTYKTDRAVDNQCLQHITTGADGSFGDKGADSLFEMVEALKTEYLHNACWILSRSALTAIRKLKDPATGSYLWQPSLAQGSPSMLLGYPVHISDAMPALKDGSPSASVAFGDFSEGYQVIERPSMSILRDPYSSKPYVEFYVSKRVGGDMINFDAIKILKFAA